MDTIPPKYANHIRRLFSDTTRAIERGVVATTAAARRRLWKNWSEWLRTYFPNYRQDLGNTPRPQQEAILAAYTHHVRSGGFSNGKQQVRAQTVQMVLSAITATLLLDGQQSPLVHEKGSYPKPISQLLEGYKREDPPPQPKLAVPVRVPNLLVTTGTHSVCQKTKAIGDMAIIAFYYLLRVGEYTYHKPDENRKTKQFCIGDVKFWKGTKLLPQSKTTNYLITNCTAATLSIVAQKNDAKNQSVHHEALNKPLCPIRALIRRVKTIRKQTANPRACLGTYKDIAGMERILHARDITNAVRRACSTLKLHENGLTPKLVGSHSLRAGGAMAMYLNGVPHDTIRKIGRWTSDTFLMYIHEQIAHFSAGVTTKMSTEFPFHNVHFQRGSQTKLKNKNHDRNTTVSRNPTAKHGNERGNPTKKALPRRPHNNSVARRPKR